MLQDTGTAAFPSFRRDPCGPGTASVSRDTYLSTYLKVFFIRCTTFGISLCSIYENVAII